MSSPISPVKVSDLNFIPELFFDLIARVIPGYFVLGFAYLYIEIFMSLSYFDFGILSKIPIWSTPIIAYYLAIFLSMIFRISNKKRANEIEIYSKKLYKLTHNAPEDRARFLRIFAEFHGSSSILVGLTSTLILSFVCSIINFSYIKNLDLSLAEKSISFIQALIAIIVLFICFLVFFIQQNTSQKKIEEIIEKIGQDLPNKYKNDLDLNLFLNSFLRKNIMPLLQNNSFLIIKIKVSQTYLVVFTILFLISLVIALRIKIIYPDSLAILNTINIFVILAIYLWQERLQYIIKLRLNNYEKYTKSLSRENWAKDFNDGSAKNINNQAIRFDVFTFNYNNRNTQCLIISPYEINYYGCQVLIALDTQEKKEYPTHINCEVETVNQVNDKKIEKITFALDQIYTINRTELTQKKFGHVILDDQQKILDVLARMFA